MKHSSEKHKMPLSPYRGRKFKYRFIKVSILTMLCFPFPSFANESIKTDKKSVIELANQSRTIRGTITDENGEPMIGVSILVKGTQGGTITDYTGNYEIEATNGSTLLISFIGYKPQEILVGNSSTLNLSLQPDTQALDEVVVIGYGTIRKRDLTGSVSSVKSDDIVRSPASNAMEALQGQIPGLDITRTSGKASSGVNINIRGKRTLSDIKDENDNLIAHEPLFIIDGIQGGNFADIAPQDIESIEVLKDASSTAIYGSQGANGVIILTTKKGSQGKTKVAYNGYYGVNGWGQYPKMRTGEDYIQLRREAYRTANQWNSTEDDQKLFSPEEWTALQAGQWTNWIDEVNRNGSVQSHQVTASGGTERTTAFLSAGYYQEKGALRDDEMNKYNLRMNIDHKVGKIIHIGTNSQVTHYATDDRADYALWRAATNVPLGLPYDENGKVNLFPLGQTANVSPLADEATSTTARHHRLTTNVMANGYLDIRPIAGLSLRSNVGTNLHFNRKEDFESPNSIERAGRNNDSFSSIQTSEKSFVSWDNIVNYTKDIKSIHTVGFTGLTSWTQSKYRSSTAQGTGQQLPGQLWHNLEANDKDSYQIYSQYIQHQTLSYALRLNYSFMGRYLFTASNRWDGDSRLSTGNKWASFPSVAVGWRISEEAWLRNVDVLDNLKIRFSWGVTGNSGINAYGTQSYLLTNTNAGFQDNPYTYYSYSEYVGNHDVSWEKSRTWDLGFDISLFNNRINTTIDLYDTKTTDLLLPRTLPTSMGSGNNKPFKIYQNIGSTRNRGIEVALTTVNVVTSKFNWNTTFTFAANKEEITDLIDGRDIIASTEPETKSLLVGKPVNSFYTYKRQGIWQTHQAAEAATYFKDENKTQSFKPGDIKVADLNGDHIIDSNDMTYIGSTSPKWTLGFNNNFQYKNFDLNLYFIMRWGQMIDYDFTRAYDPQGRSNSPAYLNYWTPENPSNDFPRPDQTNLYNYLGYQSLSYIDGSYLKLKTLSLGYTFNKNRLSKAHISNLRIYATANHLFTVAKSHLIKYYDPERGGSARAPLQRQFVLGVNVEF